MLLSQNEACKLQFRSERIPYHSARSHLFFSNNFARKRNGKISPVLGRLISTFHKKIVFFFGRKKNFPHINKGYCLLISVMFHLHG